MSAFSLDRHPLNPVLTPDPAHPWEARCVLNPAVVHEDGVFYLYYRSAGEDTEHRIHIGLATSRDGVHFTRSASNPLLSPRDGDFDGGCVEDPRITDIDGVRYMTYAYRPYPPGQYWIKTKPHPSAHEAWDVSLEAPTALTGNVTATALAMIQHKTDIKRLGRITRSDVDDRDVVLFPERIDGRYVRISRPVRWSGEGYPCEKPAIWMNFSPSLLDWDESGAFLLMKGETWWEEKKIGAGTPPLRTDRGWLMLYHGVDMKGVYRVGAVLMDLHDPRIILGRTRDFILQPELPYETAGIYNGCVFPTGMCAVNGTLYVYYGAADQFCCLATCSLEALVDHLLA